MQYVLLLILIGGIIAFLYPILGAIFYISKNKNTNPVPRKGSDQDDDFEDDEMLFVADVLSDGELDGDFWD